MERNSLISERYLLRGAPNARDLGGLPTMDGRKVRTGLLLRSGELAGITDADAHTLSQYPLRTVIDFRTDLEREQKPDRVLAGVRYIHCPIVQQAAAGLTREEQADPYGAVVAHAKTMAGQGTRVHVRDVPEPCHARLLDRALPAVFCPSARTDGRGAALPLAPRARTASASARCCC